MPAEDCNTKKPKAHTVSVNVRACSTQQCLALFCTTAVGLGLKAGQNPAWRGTKNVWMLPLPLVSHRFVSHSEWHCVLCLPKGTIVSEGHQMQMFDCDHPPNTIARFQVVAMLISHLLIIQVSKTKAINRCPNQGQLLCHFWYSSNPSVSHPWELSNLFALYFWVSLLLPLLPELISCGVRWALVWGNQVRLNEREIEDMERETGPCLLLTISI